MRLESSQRGCLSIPLTVSFFLVFPTVRDSSFPSSALVVVVVVVVVVVEIELVCTYLLDAGPLSDKQISKNFGKPLVS